MYLRPIMCIFYTKTPKSSEMCGLRSNCFATFIKITPEIDRMEISDDNRGLFDLIFVDKFFV